MLFPKTCNEIQFINLYGSDSLILLLKEEGRKKQMQVIQKNIMFKKKEMEKKKDKQDNRDRRGHPASVQDYSTNNKAIFFSIHKQF